jgi:HK97 family phage major capsid protein
MKNIELRGQRAELIKGAMALVDNAQKEGRSLNAEEQQKFDAMEGDARSMMTQIETLERAADMKKELASQEEARQASPKQSRTAVFGKYLKRGFAGLNAEERAQLTSSDAAGGYLVPEGFSGVLDVATAFTGQVERVAKKLDTASGNPLDYPTVNDTGNDAAIATEGAATSETDMTFGNVAFNSYNYTSLVRVSKQLIDDAGFNLDSFLVEALGERIARKTNADFTTGDGSGKPKGIVDESTLGATVATSGALVANDVLNLIHSIDPSYRNKASFGLMCSGTIMALLQKLGVGSSNDFPIFIPSMTAGQPDKLFGYNVYYNNDMETDLDAADKVMIAADFDKYVVRRAGGVQIIRLNERYMDEMEIGYLVSARRDGHAVDTRAIKHLIGKS